jgi:hypothetical protein
MEESRATPPSAERPRLSEMQGGTQEGLACPKCGCHHFDVVYTRPKRGCIRRLRECHHCGHRMPTWERA